MSSTSKTEQGGPISRADQGRAYLVLILLEFVAAAGLATLYAMLATLYREYGDARDGVGWAVTAYLLVSAGGGALCGRLGDLLGRRRMILILLVIATIGSLISGFVPTLGGLILGCLLQGAAGALFPLIIGLARELLSSQQVPVAVGVINAAGIAGSGVLYLGAGWVTDHFASHGAFLFKTGLAILAFLAVLMATPGRRPVPRGAGGMDYVRGALFAPAFAAILLGIDRANVWGWHDLRPGSLIVAGLLSLVFWARHQLQQREPLIDLRLLLRRQTLLANLAQIFLGLGCMQAGQMLSLFWQQPRWTGSGFGLSAAGAGWLFLALYSTSVIASPWSGYIGTRHGARRSGCIGALLTVIAWIAMAVSHHSYEAVLGAALVNILGVAVMHTAVYNLIVEVTPAERTGEAVGVAYISFIVALAIGSQILFTILNSSIVGGGASSAGRYPTDRAFTTAFLYMAFMCAASLVTLAAMPRTRTAASGGSQVPRRAGPVPGCTDVG